MTDQYPDLERILISTEAIQERIKELARQIDQDYRAIDRLYIIGIL